jgi:hypothetical protein
MNDPLNGGNRVGLVELKKDGYFKMQIEGFLNLVVVNQDYPIDHGDVPRIIEHISARVELKPENERSPMVSSHLTVSKLAHWFSDNQQSITALQKPS